MSDTDDDGRLGFVLIPQSQWFAVRPSETPLLIGLPISEWKARNYGCRRINHP